MELQQSTDTVILNEFCEPTLDTLKTHQNLLLTEMNTADAEKRLKFLCDKKNFDFKMPSIAYLNKPIS